MAEQKIKPVNSIDSSESSDMFEYIELDVLGDMTVDELEAIWDLVPTEDRDYLTRRYGTVVKKEAVASDEQEIVLINTYVERYKERGLVPAGEQWVRLNPAKRQEMKTGDTDIAEFEEDDSGGLPWTMIAVISFGVFLVIFLGAKVLGNSNNVATTSVEATLTPTLTPTHTYTPSPVPSITSTPSPTPIALIESDSFIEAGDGRNRNFFPVQFQVVRPSDDQPRVFIVQERLVKITEWLFDPNPDVVSWISQTRVRPVLGIPFSPANEDFIRSLNSGSSFVLRMNTGSELQFNFSFSGEVGREHTSLFQQSEPGVVLVLVGKRDKNNLPTSTRYVVSASYDAHREVDLTRFSDLPSNVGDLIHLPLLSFSVDDSYIIPISENTSNDFRYAVVDMTLTGGESDVSLSAYQLFLDTDQSRYSPDLSSIESTYETLPSIVPAGEQIQVSVSFLVSTFDEDSLLLFTSPDGISKSVRIPFDPLYIPSSVENLDVQLRRIWRDDSRVFVDVRLYNTQNEALTLELDDVNIIFGFTPNPVGPIHHPIDYVSTVFEPGHALDITFTFDWNADDPFATLTLAERVWSINLVR